MNDKSSSKADGPGPNVILNLSTVIKRIGVVNFVRHIAMMSTLVVSFFSIGWAQQDDVAPPPLKLISKSERELLNSKPEPKDRANLTLELMNARLRSAEKYSADENYMLMYAELGGFQGLMDTTLDFLLHYNAGEGKKLNSLKRFEIGLRGFIPRIESIRRELPQNFEPYVKYLIRYVGDAREKAIKPFFANTVIS